MPKPSGPMANYAPIWNAGAETIGALDTMIAAHALSQQAVLVTNNTREFSRVAGLQLDNWALEAP